MKVFWTSRKHKPIDQTATNTDLQPASCPSACHRHPATDWDAADYRRLAIPTFIRRGISIKV